MAVLNGNKDEAPGAPLFFRTLRTASPTIPRPKPSEPPSTSPETPPPHSSWPGLFALASNRVITASPISSGTGLTLSVTGPVASGPLQFGIAADDSDNVWVANSIPDNVQKIPAGTSTTNAAISRLNPTE